MAHTSKDKKQLMTRVRRIQGQAVAIESALDKDADCAAILQQIAAIKGAVNGLMLQVIEGHVREHLGSAEVSEAQRQNDLEEVLAVLRSYLK